MIVELENFGYTVNSFVKLNLLYELNSTMMRLIYSGLLFLVLLPCQLFAAHGVSIDGNLKYPSGFTHFDYISPDAVKGGALTMHDLGSFDKMNPFTLKGQEPGGLTLFVFETLAVASLDEPFAEYGLIAKDIELADDKMSVTFTIDENAKFSDGSPVTVKDVKFSLDTLKSDAAHPQYQIYMKDITKAEILDKSQVRFHFTRQNRELHMIAAQLPIMSLKFYEKHGFNSISSKNTMVPPVGSGPYIVDKVIPGKSITYKRNPDYWAKDHPTRKGMFNFDTITIDYYRDQIVSLEAFKAGEFDFMSINIAKQWARDLDGKFFDSSKLIKKLFPHKNNAGMQGFVFNTRRHLFKDTKVRQALGLALDFEWTNKTLFFDQYTRNNSYFSNSNLAATGLPDEKELSLLEPFRKDLPAEVFNSPLVPPTTKTPSSLRKNLRMAKKLLMDSGWKVKNGILTNQKGETFSFELLLVSPSFERVMAPYVKNLEKLGIKASYRTIDAALYIDRMKNFDFDMMVTVYGQSQSPGNEQRNYWHSSSADQNGSRNLAGINDPVVDKLVDAIIYATTQDELTAACKALDRVLWYGYYVVPNWYLASHRLAYNPRLNQPKTLPLYYSPDQLLMTWWDGDANK